MQFRSHPRSANEIRQVGKHIDTFLSVTIPEPLEFLLVERNLFYRRSGRRCIPTSNQAKGSAPNNKRIFARQMERFDFLTVQEHRVLRTW